MERISHLFKNIITILDTIAISIIIILSIEQSTYANEGPITDTNPPVLESFEFLEQGQKLSVGDTVHYKLKVTDDSGVDLDRTYPVIYSGDHYLSFKKTYNKSTGYIEGSYTFTEKDFVGTYSLGYIPCYDIYGNYYHGILSESHYIKFMTCTTGEDEHQWNTKYTVDKEATCKEEGSESIHCSICGTIQERTSRVIPKTNHTYGNWRIKKEATCTKDGLKEKICSICNNKVTETIPLRGHVWNTKYTIDKKATYEAVGLKSIHCSICDTIKPNSVVSIKKLKVKTPTVSKLIILKKGFIIKWKKITSANSYQVQYALNSKFTKGNKMEKITKTATVSKKVTKLKAKKKYYIRVRTYKVVSGKTYYSAWSKAKIVTTKK